MPQGPSLSAKRQLMTILKHFKFEEIETAIIPTFPEVTWSSIRSRLVKAHQSFTVANVINVILAKMNAINITDDELMERVTSLELIDISIHHAKKMWYAHSLRNAKIIEFMSNRDIQQRISQYFHKHKMNVDVRILAHDGIIFVMIKEKPKKRLMKRIMPTFISFLLEREYFFCTKKYMASHISEAVTTGLGYEKSKVLKLNSRDIHSMMRMLWTRKSGALQGEYIKEPITYKEREPEYTRTGIDFSQYKARKELADKCFGNDPPNFETLKVNSSDQHWKHKEAFKKLPGKTFRMEWEFRHTSIPKMLQELIIRRVIVIPLPFYVHNLLSLGRTELTLRET